MTDYFGYDVHFAMNITDIDDKATPHVCCTHGPWLTFQKIIAQSRKNYLFENFQSEISWAPIEVLVEIQTAWERYVRKHLAAGLPEEEKPPEGQEETTWKAISEKVKDENWKTECLKRDEKFDMHFRASVSIVPLCSNSLTQSCNAWLVTHLFRSPTHCRSDPVEICYRS